MSVGENIRRYRKSRGMTQAQLAEAVGLTEGAVRHYESGIRAVKPELLESISAALGVSVNALKDYGVETAGDLMSLLVRLEDSFGIVPAADGRGLSLNPKAPHAPKAAMTIELWAEKRAQLENGEIDAAEYEDWKASL
ncbi:helix-turn-helix domain-containing protein [Parvibacter caecicola]|uniref:Helix-turn-helix transcriptional regulator n=1 Tax=Parvibacter caecicola TaxID=747645 RepID=A0A4V6W9T1_9ACTN|nr:helix-turn-helix transcriptional regulator [Parvibacter caecicola]TJW11176.1 helix-turn-helix transcriptional regulator [Parvibacter caecicola]